MKLTKNPAQRLLTVFCIQPCITLEIYGFIPHTPSGDGRSCRCSGITRQAVVPGSVMRVRPVGVLLMEDDGGIDEKLLLFLTLLFIPITTMSMMLNKSSLFCVKNFTLLLNIAKTLET